MSFYKHLSEKFTQVLSEKLFEASEKLLQVPQNIKSTIVSKSVLELLFMIYQSVDDKTKLTIKQDMEIFLEECNKDADLNTFSAPEIKEKN